MKQFRIFFCTAALILLCFCTALSVGAAEYTVIDGSELATAFKTLAETGGTVTLGDDIILDANTALPKTSKTVTLDGGGHSITLGANLGFNGTTAVKNVTFVNDATTYRSIFCNGNRVHFYSSVKCERLGSTYPSIMAGNSKGNAYEGSLLTIDGGTWQRVRGGNANAASVKQVGSVLIKGGTFMERFQVGGSGAMAEGSKINVTVKGGTFRDGIVFFTTTGTATAETSLVIDGGTFFGKIRVSDSVGTFNGSCTIRINGGDFSECTGITGYSGKGNLHVKTKLSQQLYDTVYDLQEVDSLDTTLLHTGMADPCLIYTNGYYYLTATGSSNIGLIKSKTLAGVKSKSITSALVYKSAEDVTATDTLGYTEVNGTWSPELHYFDAADFGEEYAGWYMYLALRKKGDDSSSIRMVALKSQGGDTPDGPYVHPTDGTKYKSQLILDKSGKSVTAWGCGMSILRIESGSYKGIYAMWVAEENRGTANFRQKIMIAKMKNPWQLAADPVAILYPTQYWETIGQGQDANGTWFPAVVEGATALYGKDGQVYIIYCGSGYWTNYGLGQLTWNGGNPTAASSWVKYANNPVFGANNASGTHYSDVPLQGAGHAFFTKSASGKMYAVYHAYPSSTAGVKADGAKRNAYIETCRIDYTLDNGVGKGVLRFNTKGNRPAPVSTAVDFTTRYEKNVFKNLLDTDGMSVVITGYDAQFDHDGDGDCDLADVLYLLNAILNDTSAKTLADVFDTLAYIMD